MSAPDSFPSLSPWRIALPVTIGVAASVYLLVGVSHFHFDLLRQLAWSQQLVWGLVLAALSVAVRDLAYMYRIWKLTDRQLTLRKCFEVIFLWEFGSSITPASVGGITMALFILHKERISLGKSSAIIMFCSYLDNIAFVWVFSLLYLLVGSSMFDLSATCAGVSNQPAFHFFRTLGPYVWIGFLAVAFSGGMLGFAIFVKPHFAKRFLQRLADIKWLNRWRQQIIFWGEEIEYTSREFKDKGFIFLLQVLAATTLSWCARYALANALIFAFSDDALSQLAVFARQYVHRVIVMIPATPGGSGLAEITFMAMNCEFIRTGYEALVATLWRLFNFYFYIALGLVILPGWLVRIQKNK